MTASAEASRFSCDDDNGGAALALESIECSGRSVEKAPKKPSHPGVGLAPARVRVRTYSPWQCAGPKRAPLSLYQNKCRHPADLRHSARRVTRVSRARAERISPGFARILASGASSPGVVVSGAGAASNFPPQKPEYGALSFHTERRVGNCFFKNSGRSYDIIQLLATVTPHWS